MILYTNGCSWTWGGALEPYFLENINDTSLDYNEKINHEKRLNIVWPAHLGKLLNATNVINQSEGAASNQRLFRTTYNWIKSQPQEILDQTVFILQFTELSRIEFYIPLTNDDNDEIATQWIKCLPNCVCTEFQLSQGNFNWSELTDRCNDRLSKSTDIEDIYRNLTYILSLKAIFDMYNIKSYYFWSLGLGNIPYWKKLLSYNHRLLHNLNMNILDNDMLWEYDRVSDTDYHPSIDGHKQIAEIIYNKIKDK